MSATSNTDIQQDPKVFSRGSIMLTYSLLRKENPSLALSIRNLTGGEPLSKPDDETNNKNNDHFKLEVDSFEVRAVVETLTKVIQSNAPQSADAASSGQAIMAQALLDDWLKLARVMFKEYQEETGNNEVPGTGD